MIGFISKAVDAVTEGAISLGKAIGVVAGAILFVFAGKILLTLGGEVVVAAVDALQVLATLI